MKANKQIKTKHKPRRIDLERKYAFMVVRVFTRSLLERAKVAFACGWLAVYNLPSYRIELIDAFQFGNPFKSCCCIESHDNEER